MMVCTDHPHMEAIGSQLKMRKGLYTFGIFRNLGILMYLAPKYM